MGVYSGQQILNALPAHADLHASQFCAVVENSSGEYALAGANVRISGVLQDTPNAEGQRATACVAGVTIGKAGAAVTQGALLETDSSGQFITCTTSGHLAVGEAVASAAGSGSLFAVRLFDAPYLHP